MRKITLSQILVFEALFLVVLALSLGTTSVLLGAPLGDFRGVVLVAVAVVTTYWYGFVVYRLFLRFVPLVQGQVGPGSRAEFAAQVNILFYLVLFNSLVRTNFLPVPLMRWVYLALGARLGANSYSAGAILDPPLTTMGSGCIIGHNAVVYAHSIEGDSFSLRRVCMGDRVTIGAMAVVMSGVSIADDAIVCAGAVVLKDTTVAPGEIWGGVPARRIGCRALVRRSDGMGDGASAFQSTSEV